MSREETEIEEIYHESGELLNLLTQLNSKWVYVRDLINKHNYTHLTQFNEQSNILDTLFSAEQQIRETRNYYYKKLKDGGNGE